MQVVAVKGEASGRERRGANARRMRILMQKKRWKSTPWKMGSSLFDGVDWERWKKNKIPLELSKVPTALELFSLRSRRNKKDQDGPRRTLILMKAQDGPRRTLILKKAQNRPRGTLI